MNAKIISLNNNFVKFELIKSKFLKWSEQSSCHGYSNIFRSEKYIAKVLWVFFWLASIGACSYFIIESIFEYFHYEVTSKIVLVDDNDMEFPAITICPSYPFITETSKKYVLEYFKNKTKINITSSDEIENFYKSSGDLIEEIFMLQMNILHSNLSYSIKRSFTFNTTQFFIMCLIARTKCDFNEFRWAYDGFHSGCYIINSGYDSYGNKISVKKVLPSMEYGMRFVLLDFVNKKN